MPARTLKFFICIFMTVFLCGCWDSRNIEDRDICTAVVVDKTNGGYAYIVEIATITSTLQNPSSEQGTQKPNIITANGKTLADARFNLDRRINKVLFMGAVQTVIFTKRMAQSGIEEYVYRVRELNEYRKSVDVIVTSDDPFELLNFSPENATAVGFAIEYDLENMFNNGKTFHMSLADLLDKLASKNKACLISAIGRQEKQIGLVGYAVFNNGKMLGTISLDESRGIVYIVTGRHSRPYFDYVVPIGNSHVTIEAKMVSREFTAGYSNGKAHFHLNFIMEGTERYPANAEPVTGEKEEKARMTLEKMLLKEFTHALDLSQKEYCCDFMSLSETFRITYPDEYAAMDWQETFKNADFTVSVSVKMNMNKAYDYNPYR